MDSLARPVLMLHAPQGVDVDTKRKMLKKINEAVANTDQRLPDFRIFIQEYPLELVAHDRGLHADNQQQVDAQRRAYSPGGAIRTTA
jgi:hypothetical protein